jgi:hypothetical protein
VGRAARQAILWLLAVCFVVLMIVQHDWVLVAVVVCIGLPMAWLAARNRTEIEHWRSYWLKRLTRRNTK